MQETFTREEVEDLVNLAIQQERITRMFNIRIVDRQLQYDAAVPGRHFLRDKDGNMWDVLGCDGDMISFARNGIHRVVMCYNIRPEYEIVDTGKDAVHGTGSSVDYGIGPGDIFTHRNGNRYLVYGFANVKAREDLRDKYPLLVLYVGENGYVWAKPMDTFHESMTKGGNFSFQDSAKFEYMGVVSEGALQNGFITDRVQAMFESTQGTV